MKILFTRSFEDGVWKHYRNGELVFETSYEIDFNTAPRDRFPFMWNEADETTEEQKEQYKKNVEELIKHLKK